MIAIRLGLYLSLMLLLGLAAFPLYALRDSERPEGKILTLRKTLIFWSGAAIILSVLGFLALMAAMMGTSIADIDWAMCRTILFETPIGNAWLVRIAALVAALVAALAIDRSVKRRLITVATASAIALSTLVWTGHAGASEGTLGSLHKASDILHMLAAAIWLGGIAAFLRILQAPDDGIWGDRLTVAHRSLDSFSRVGTICVAVIVITGMINGQILVGLSNISSVFESTYGQLLVLKLVLVGAMLFLGAKNRWRLTPDLGMVLPEGNTATAVAALRTSLLLEAGAALAILGLVAWLGMLEPPASMTMP